MFHGLCTTVIGDSHVKKGIVCQDSSGVVAGDEYAVAVVADGHGSAKHFRSDVGSSIAVKISIGLLSRYLERKDFRDQFLSHSEFILNQLEKQLLMKWREAVEEYHRENPLTEEEKEAHPDSPDGKGRTAVIYGSTLLVAAISEAFSFGIVLGDGGFVCLDGKGRLFVPVEDEHSHANYTSSLCNTDAIRYFRHWYSTEKTEALFVSTDGLFKSFASDEDFLRYHGLLAKMYQDPDKTLASLNRNFEKRTREGSGDDISIAFIYEDNRGDNI